MFSRLVIALTLFAIAAAPARAHHLRFTSDLSGSAESPANNSPGSGHVVVTLDLDLGTLEVAASFTGLQGAVTAANIHAATLEAGTGSAAPATPLPSFPEFPSGVLAGRYEHEFDMAEASTYNPAFIAASGGTISTAENALIFALEDGKAYFEINTAAYNNGEIRGFLSHVPGDYNLNGVVDAADYVVWRNTLGDIGDGLVADSNDNSIIDNDDYDTWRTHFGQAGLSNLAGGSLTAPSIPEPAPATLLTAICVAAFASRYAPRPVCC
jgi:hypothetical protein